MTVRVRGAKGWRSRIGGGSFSPGGGSKRLAARPGKSTTFAFRRRGIHRVRRFHVRCLPGDFPAYGYSRSHPGGPDLFFTQLPNQYMAIVDHHGVPVWWYKADGEPDNAQLLPDGTLAWDPVQQLFFQSGDYEIHSLKGRLIRTVRGAGDTATDVHDVQLLPNGDYVIGAQVKVPHVDTSAYGGSEDSTITEIEIQEVTPKGKVVSKWDSEDHIGLDETPQRWWDRDDLDDQPYDVVHWNSVAIDGNTMLLSFRHLDAVYLVNRKTGDIIWKLGGTETPKSLDVVGDPHGDSPFGGQHDARFLPGGTISIHDNRTGLNGSPRAARYAIDADAGTARLVQSIGDEGIDTSFCCGSARYLQGGDWLIDWGGTGLVGGYDARGRNLFRFTTPDGFGYRANPIPDGQIKVARLRRAMDAISKRSR